LRRKYALRPVETTIRSHAYRLASYIGYLRNERGLDHPEEALADVFAATEDDLNAFYRSRQFTEETRVSSASWRGQLSTIKQFHEFLRELYDVPLPFRLTTFMTAGGFTGTTAPDLRPRTKVGSRGTPITPGFAELLVQGAYRIDRDGRQQSGLVVDRDAAFVSLGLATGMRLGSLSHVTTYEIPEKSSGPFTTIRVPDFITKGDAGGDALVFAHHLSAVHNYIGGARAEQIGSAKRPYRPKKPLQIVDADADQWSIEADGKRRSYRWAETDEVTRRRLVNPDGTTPVVWLNAYKPSPITYDQAGGIVSGARDWTREHILEEFPGRFRTHDLRHTYATHLTVCIFKQAIAPHVHPDVSDAYLPVRVADAVEIAKLSLGHASESSTRLYVQSAHRFLDIDIHEFLGER
jgi:integrase